MSTYIVVVDDEPDVESMFRQQFRRDLKSGPFVMKFTLSAPAALEQVKAIPEPSPDLGPFRCQYARNDRS